MTSETYTCDWCEGTFAKGWTDEEAEEESLRLFGKLAPDDRVLMCDDCFKEGMR